VRVTSNANAFGRAHGNPPFLTERLHDSALDTETCGACHFGKCQSGDTRDLMVNLKSKCRARSNDSSRLDDGKAPTNRRMACKRASIRRSARPRGIPCSTEERG